MHIRAGIPQVGLRRNHVTDQYAYAALAQLQPLQPQIFTSTNIKKITHCKWCLDHPPYLLVFWFGIFHYRLSVEYIQCIYISQKLNEWVEEFKVLSKMQPQVTYFTFLMAFPHTNAIHEFFIL